MTGLQLPRWVAYISRNTQLKGVLGNLSLTPLYDLAVDITENLRISKEIDYFELINKLLNKREELLNK